ncbi:unnamed protein product, partial [Owenia fusiformis]
MANTKIAFSASLTTSDPNVRPVVIIGQVKHLLKVPFEKVKCKLQPRVTEEVYNAAALNLQPSPTDTCSLWLSNATLAALPTKASRHNTPSRGHSISRIVKSCASGGDEFFLIVCERANAFASACAVARAFPLYSRKSGVGLTKRTVTVEFIFVGENSEDPLSDKDLQCMTDTAYAIRLAAKIVDIPCSEMHTDAFIQEITTVGKELGISPKIVQGEDLDKQGFGGLYGVGKCAVHKPALAVLSHTPEGASRTIAWVGKGIVYDTGGLS